MKNHSRRSPDCGDFGLPVPDRREFLRRSALGLGTLGLAQVLSGDGRLMAEGHGRIDVSKLNGTALSVILLFQGGGPSHVDSWDPKPELVRLRGKDVPESIAAAVPMNERQRLQDIFPSPYRFKRYGESGIQVSDLFPETGKMVDDICVVRSMRHETPVHTPAEFLLTTGSLTGSRPSLGSWLYYGMGTANQDLPGFIVMVAGENFAGSSCWSAGFLPPTYQGTVVQADSGIPHLSLPPGYTRAGRRQQLDLLSRLNRRHLERSGNISELEARIESYELAFRMQLAAPDVFDLSQESDTTKKLYGIDRKESVEYGTNCLLARRLVERGVRFIQLNQGGWDSHARIEKGHREYALKTDRPIAGLLADLKGRGLLDQTLVVWGGEFGRTPTAQGTGPSVGRDHSASGFTMWLAGGGVRGGQVIGATDPIGYTTIERPIHPHDLHATILYGLGIDQRELYYEHQNRKEIVTFNGGSVVREVFG